MKNEEKDKLPCAGHDYEDKRRNVWNWHGLGYHVVVSTNIGWSREGWNNMGAGLALQASRQCPDLSLKYGAYCKELALRAPSDKIKIPLVAFYAKERLVMLPVKPFLDPRNPERSWDQPASLDLIESSVIQLALGIKSRRVRRGQDPQGYVMTLPGAGNGGLDPSVVSRLIAPLIKDLWELRVVDASLVAPAVDFIPLADLATGSSATVPMGELQPAQ